MKAIIALGLIIFGLIIIVMKRDQKRRAAYEAWKKEKGLTTEDCGL